MFTFCSFILSLLLVFYLYHIHFVYIYTLSVDLILQHVIIEVEMGTKLVTRHEQSVAHLAEILLSVR